MAADKRGKRSSRGKEKPWQADGERGGGKWAEDQGMEREIEEEAGVGEDTALHPQSSVRFHKYQ